MKYSDQEPIRQPVIDTDYIDQLLSTYTPAAEDKTEPAEAPAEPAPAAEKPVPKAAVPKKKGYRKPLLILGAITLLMLGFLAGAWLNTDKMPADGTSATDTVPTTTLPSFLGYIPNYDAMSTAELAVLASKITEFAHYGQLTPEIYSVYETEYPVLTALKTRQDVIPILENIQQTSYDIGAENAARVLIEYFTNYIYVDEPEAGDIGIAVDYASMSTAELIAIAVQIDTLSSLGSPLSSTMLTPKIYETLEHAHPVLTELKQRPDLVEQLYAFTPATTEETYAIQSLLTFISLTPDPADT